MSLTLEWRERLETWLNELKKHFYIPLGRLELEGFATQQQLTRQQAARGHFRPMPSGTKWGAKWEYGWFRCQVRIPAKAAGRRVVFCGRPDGEMLVCVNGREAGSISGDSRSNITLTPRARAGGRFEILMESYAGHGPTPCHCGPLPPGRVCVPEPPPTQRTVGESSFGIWDEEAWALWLDAQTLLMLRDALPADSLRAASIDAGLRDFTTLVDFETPPEEMRRTFHAARRRLAPLLACRNGSTAPTFFAFGHGHIDVAWLWPLEETERKAARTFANQLALIAEYPGFKFLQSQPYLHSVVKQRYPELYERWKAAVKAGRIIAEGGMWVEPDMNLSGGEALVRQCIYGKRFFREEFGIESRLLWLPDVFGYSGALPQILRGCGIPYFSTSKIFWTYQGGDPFPYNTFTWEGIDGSTVLAHLFVDYSSGTDPRTLTQRWNQRVQKDDVSALMLSFGWGDGGGGPTREHVEFARRAADLEGCPRVKLAGPVEFFKEIERQGIPPARYVGELYFQAHRGTYTSQARTKRGNRKSEVALREAELWSAAAQALTGFAFPAEETRTKLAELWRSVLTHQFHDILPGSSIRRVYEEAESAHAQVIAGAEEITSSATRALARKGRGLTVFNSLNWPRTAFVPLPKSWKAAGDESGQALRTQRVAGTTYAEVMVPSCGWTTVMPARRPATAPAALGSAALAGKNELENEMLRLRFNDRGEITSIYDREADREIAAGPCNAFRMYKDVPFQFDAWDLDSPYEFTPVALDAPAKVQVLAQGPLMAQLRITRRLNRSTMSQTVTLRAGSRRVDFDTLVDWRETHKLLKVAFAADCHANEAVHEIQFGHLRRPNHRSRQYDADRFEVANHKWSALVEEGRGFAVLNDCKYGLNVLGNTIALTLLRAPKAPDMEADQGPQRFTYAFYVWNGSLAESGVVREAYDLNHPAVVAEGAGGTRSLFQVDAPTVVIESIKPAEDGAGHIIVRLYESKRVTAACALSTTLPVKRAWATDLLENRIGELPLRGNAVRLDFRPFEIKTVRLAL